MIFLSFRFQSISYSICKTHARSNLLGGLIIENGISGYVCHIEPQCLSLTALRLSWTSLPYFKLSIVIPCAHMFSSVSPTSTDGSASTIHMHMFVHYIHALWLVLNRPTIALPVYYITKSTSLIPPSSTDPCLHFCCHELQAQKCDTQA